MGVEIREVELMSFLADQLKRRDAMRLPSLLGFLVEIRTKVAGRCRSGQSL
jgi:hypothetical protein